MRAIFSSIGELAWVQLQLKHAQIKCASITRTTWQRKTPTSSWEKLCITISPNSNKTMLFCYLVMGAVRFVHWEFFFFFFFLLPQIDSDSLLFIFPILFSLPVKLIQIWLLIPCSQNQWLNFHFKEMDHIEKIRLHWGNNSHYCYSN